MYSSDLNIEIKESMAMNNQANQQDNRATSLEELVANTCFCKLREFCHDKNSAECMKHRNIYQEFMQSKSTTA